ncbi:MAG: IS3 family transposase [Trueperaceae bacterium]
MAKSREEPRDVGVSRTGQDFLDSRARGESQVKARTRASETGTRHLKKSGGVLRQGKQMRYAFIKEHRLQWTVTMMCKVLEVAVSGFYHWLKRPVSKRIQENEELTKQILMFHCGRRCTYGSPRIHKDMKAAGYRVSENRVARLMKQNAIQGKAKREFKTTTTSKHQRPRVENLVKQNFQSAEPNKLWVSDITYIATLEGWLYLAVILDVFSRKIIGWAFSERLTDDLVLAALLMAKHQRQTAAGLIHHSDQGSQYASHDFQASLKDHDITQSMSGRGNCYDNALAESFFATLKTEEADGVPYETRQQGKTSIFSYIETFYNAKRRHSSLNYLSPDDFERLYLAKVA